MQAFWLGHQRGVVQSTFRKWRLQNRPPVSTVPTVVVASRSIVTPTQCLESETSSSLPSRQRSISSPFNHQPTTAPTTLLFSPAAKKQNSVSHFHTHSCQLAQSRKGMGIFWHCVWLKANEPNSHGREPTILFSATFWLAQVI